MAYNCLSTSVIHYTPLVDRRQNVDILLDVFRCYSPSLITESYVSEFTTRRHHLLCSNRSELFRRRQAPIVADAVILNASRNTFRGLTKEQKDAVALDPSILETSFPFIDLSPPGLGTIEHCLQHYCAMAGMLVKGSEWNVVLEDDALLISESRLLAFLELLLDYTSFSRCNPIYIDLSNGCGLTPGHDIDTSFTYSRDEKLSRMHLPRTRTSVAYLYNKKFAEEAVQYLKQIYMAIDWHMTFVMNSIGAECYWIDKPLFTEGSAQSVYKGNASNRRSEPSATRSIEG